MDNLDRLAYWINERDRVRVRKAAGFPKPWSSDPVMQSVYFCNVNREHDTVTKWIREAYHQYPLDDVGVFELNIVLTRLINWPDTLERIGYIFPHSFGYVQTELEVRQLNRIKIFGNAYIVSTNGHKVGKAQYLVQTLLPAAWEAIRAGLPALRGTSLAGAHAALMRSQGLGSFLAAQIVADLKHTKGHPLTNASDWGGWCAAGPGSKRGLEWLGYSSRAIRDFQFTVLDVRDELIGSEILSDECEGWLVDLQNLQNCLCEFDKYMRVTNGTGKSKRKYAGE